MPNKRVCTFISGKVCLLDSIKVRGQTLLEINVNARSFGTLFSQYHTFYNIAKWFQIAGFYIHIKIFKEKKNKVANIIYKS